MPRPEPVDLDAFFAGHPFGRVVHERVAAAVAEIGPAEVRVTKSQVAFRRRRGFAYVWLPGRYLAKPDAEVVLSIALPREIGSPRWKEIAHPAPGRWIHHLEIRDLSAMDAEVNGWLREAYAAAG